jgi:hypothetical protein
VHHTVAIRERLRIRRVPSVIGVIAAAVAIRVALLVLAYLRSGSSTWFYSPDSFRYVALGTTLAAAGELSFAGVPEILRLPGYPFLIAVAWWTGHTTVATLAMQVVIAAATVWLAYRLGALTGSARVAHRAAWLAASEPLLVVYTGLLMTETLFTFLVTWSVYRGIVAKTRRQFAAAGLLTGLSALVRPVGLFLPIVLAAGIVSSRRIGDLRTRLAAAAIVVLCGGVIVGAWCVRNGVGSGYWGYSSQLDRRLLLTEAGADIAASQGRDLRDVADDMRASLGAAQPAGSLPAEAAVAVEARRRGLRYVRDHWAGVLWQHLRGSVMSLLHPPGGELNPLLSPSPQASVTFHLLAGHFREAAAGLSLGGITLTVWRVVRSLYWMGFLALTAAGVWSVLRGHPRGVDETGSPGWWPIGSALVLYLVLAAGTPYASSRFRHPLMPFLCVIAAVGSVSSRRRDV